MQNSEKPHSIQIPHRNVSAMTPGTGVAGYYIFQSGSVRNTVSGKTFLSATLSDKTGTISAIYWDYSGTADFEGQVIFVAGQISEFKGALQITVEQLRLVDERDEVDLEPLVPVAPVNSQELYQEIEEIVNTVKDPDYLSICREFLRRHGEQFRTIPAAKSVHHSFLRGLMMHTGYMLKIADYLSELYSQVVDRDLLITGTLLHDFSKREEFVFSSLGLVTDYSVKGQLLGHPVMVAQEAAEIAAELQADEKKTVLLQHVLLCHHGKPEYGAAVVPMCAEGELLSLIDNVDARMEIYRENLEGTSLGCFSGRIFALDGHRIYRHYEPKES